MQKIVFGGPEAVRSERIKENILPVMIFSSIVLGAAATPFLSRHAGPLAIAQARRPQLAENELPETMNIQKPTRSHTIAGAPAQNRKSRQVTGYTDSDHMRQVRQASNPADNSSDLRKSTSQRSLRPPVSRQRSHTKRPSSLIISSTDGLQSTSSLPDSHLRKASPGPQPPASASIASTSYTQRAQRRHSHSDKQLTPSALPRSQKIRLLRSHYFRSETAFLTALEDISSRLVAVPKAARLSALRAELALVTQDLPTEVDLPVICPATLIDGTAGRSRHHRIVRISPAEATSLNSAERVPYLLTAEILREDFDFDPDTPANKDLLFKLMAEKGTGQRRLFDLSDASREAAQNGIPNAMVRDSGESADGDLGSTSLIRDTVGDDGTMKYKKSTRPVSEMNTRGSLTNIGGTGTVGLSATNPLTIRLSEGNYNSSTLSSNQTKLSTHGKLQVLDQQQDVTALATHMRTASQMLTQLDSTSSKRPKAEVAAIQAKIIASMQTLEEQNFVTESQSGAPKYEAFDASAANAVSIEASPDLVENRVSETDPASNAGAGAARMENDQKTGTIFRRSDRDDPSAAAFGEEWSAKKERIRRSSPYGWMKTWDLVSVIVKTGADLRQEAFASQLIQICDKIWKQADVPVWVKRMRILVSGESSGLIETITNGVSLHSLKRSLTLASIAAGTNPRRRIASLRDHFIKAFGEPDSEQYATGARAFARSLAAYSMISYVLQLKDRHNGNILIDNDGHIIHIDFGFMLSNSPGSMGFEAAPFKLTHEYVNVLGGVGGHEFEEFKMLCKQAFQALRKDAERIVMLVDLMGRESKMPCFAAGVTQAVNALRARFVLHLSKDEAESFVEELIQKSLGSYYTRL